MELKGEDKFWFWFLSFMTMGGLLILFGLDFSVTLGLCPISLSLIYNMISVSFLTSFYLILFSLFMIVKRWKGCDKE